MGIQGLLPLLKSIHQHRNISEFSGQTLAVDGYVWLHRGAYGCAAQLVKGEPTTRYVDYAMNYIRLLKHHNITPYVVFDGGPLPAKKGTESNRQAARDEARTKALALAQQGKHTEAQQYYAKALDVTPEMAFQLMKALKAESIAYVCAPYEADAQLAWLERNGFVDGIITEDSDLLVFGCKQVLFKLDTNGNCVCIKREDFARVVEIKLFGWGDQQFREMAMLSGCDYLPSIRGLGVRTSHRLLRRHKTVEGVLRAIRLAGDLTIPSNYFDDFKIAELAFLYQRVYDPTAKRLVTLSEVPKDMTAWNDKYVGQDLDPHIAQGLAEGEVHPFTLRRMSDINPTYQPQSRGSLKMATVPKAVQPSQSNLLTNYFAARPTLQKTSSESAVSRSKENTSIRRGLTINAASGSGKRTLAAEHDNTTRRMSRALQEDTQDPVPSKNAQATASRFFGSKASPLTDRKISPEIEDEVPSQELAHGNQEPEYRSPSVACSELINVSSPPASPSTAPHKLLPHDKDDLSDASNVSSPAMPTRHRPLTAEARAWAAGLEIITPIPDLDPPPAPTLFITPTSSPPKYPSHPLQKLCTFDGLIDDYEDEGDVIMSTPNEEEETDYYTSQSTRAATPLSSHPARTPSPSHPHKVTSRVLVAETPPVTPSRLHRTRSEVGTSATKVLGPNMAELFTEDAPQSDRSSVIDDSDVDMLSDDIVLETQSPGAGPSRSKVSPAVDRRLIGNHHKGKSKARIPDNVVFIDVDAIEVEEGGFGYDDGSDDSVMEMSKDEAARARERERERKKAITKGWREAWKGPGNFPQAPSTLKRKAKEGPHMREMPGSRRTRRTASPVSNAPSPSHSEVLHVPSTPPQQSQTPKPVRPLQQSRGRRSLPNMPLGGGRKPLARKNASTAVVGDRVVEGGGLGLDHLKYTPLRSR